MYSFIKGVILNIGSVKLFLPAYSITENPENYTLPYIEIKRRAFNVRKLRKRIRINYTWLYTTLHSSKIH
jgi:hypothetical protein